MPKKEMTMAALALGLALAACAPRERPADEPAAAPPGGSSVAPPGEIAVDERLIVVRRPAAGEAVASPLVVRGEARGPWYFEASFPVRLHDDAGRLLAVTPAQAQGEWMTESFVPFEATLTFTTTATAGHLVLEKSNASGLPEHADSLVIPVRFATTP